MAAAVESCRVIAPIHLIGPGGAGKSVTGTYLSEITGLPLLDLDEYFLRRISGIGEYIQRSGYLAYAQENFRLYLQLAEEHGPRAIFVLSSGFMVYPDDCHEKYPDVRQRLEKHPGTILLIPSFSLDECVRMTVDRQSARDYLQTTIDRETQKIYRRFPRYMSLSCRKVETRGSIRDTALKVMSLIQADGL